jgi:hypothetical protein
MDETDLLPIKIQKKKNISYLFQLRATGFLRALPHPCPPVVESGGARYKHV